MTEISWWMCSGLVELEDQLLANISKWTKEGQLLLTAWKPGVQVEGLKSESKHWSEEQILTTSALLLDLQPTHSLDTAK